MEEGFLSADFNNQCSSVLIAVSLHVPAESQLAGPTGGSSGCIGKNCRKESQESKPLKAQRVVRLLVSVDVQLSVEEFSVDEFLNSEFLEADSDQSDVVPLEDGLESANFSRRQPTVGSSKPSEEDDNTSVSLPQFSKRRVGSTGSQLDDVVGNVLGHVHVGLVLMILLKTLLVWKD